METKFRFLTYTHIISYIYEFQEKDQLEDIDVLWAVKMFGAVLENMKNYALPIEIEEFGEQLESEEVEYLINLEKDLR